MRTQHWRWLALLGALVLSVPQIAAASLVFPRVSFDQGATTGLAIANLSEQDASVTLTAFGPDGSLLSGAGFVNPVQLDVPANQQVARTVIDLFEAPLGPQTIGWIHLTSGSEEIAGFFLHLNSSVTQFDGADLPSTARKIVFNLVRNDSEYSTEVSLINPGGVTADVTLELVQPDGSTLTQSVQIPSRGIQQLNPANLFADSSLDAGTYLVATSNTTAIAGFEFVRRGTGDLLGLNAQDAAEQRDYLYFPQLVALSPWSAELGLINYSSKAVIVTIFARKADGSLYDAAAVDSNPVTLGLEAGQSLAQDVGELFGFKSSAVVDGWLEVRASAPSLNGYLRYGIPSVGSLTAIAGATSPAQIAVFSHIATSTGFFHGLALLNSSTLTASTRILAMGTDGTVLGSLDTVIRPKERISKLLNELIPEAAGRNSGFVWIRSDQPLHTISIFGTQKTLANVPPQEAPEDYEPDEEIPQIKLTPPLAVLQPGKTQRFVAQGAPGPITWLVNGAPGGNATSGQVTADGVFTAPNAVPDPGLVSLTAESGDFRGGASIDVLKIDQLLAGLGVLQSIVYLQSAQQLYEVELVSLSSLEATSPAQTPSASNRSDLFQVVPPANRVSASQFSDNIVKMIAYTATNGREYILMVGKDSGSLLRYDTSNKQTRVVYTGLNLPTSLVYDPIKGVVLVAEADRIREIAKSLLEAGLGTAAENPDPGEPGVEESTLVSETGVTGLTLDLCTGEIYFSLGEEGLVRAYNRNTGETRTVVSGLANPGQLLTVYREGLPCPERTQLLVAEPGAERIALVAPALGVVVSWTPAPGVRDLTYLPPGNPFNLKTSIAYGIFLDLLGEIDIVEVDDQYGPDPVREETGPCTGPILFEDPNLEARIREVLGLAGGTPITCELAATISELDASSRNIAGLGGIEYLVNLQILNISDNLVENLAPIGALLSLETLDASYNRLQRPGLVPNLNLLASLNLSHNLIDDLSLLGGLDLGPTSRHIPAPRPRNLALPALNSLDLSFNRISDVGPLANLSRLRLLNLSRNSLLQEISPLGTLVFLEELLLSECNVQNIDGLVPLTLLRLIDLAGNRIADLAPLLANSGLGAGDVLTLAGNPVNLSSCTVIQLLKERGVAIDVELNCAVDLEVEIRSEVEQANRGDLLLFRGWIRNLGEEPALNVQGDFEVSPFLDLRSFRTTGGTCSRAGQTVTCTWPTLPPRGRAEILIRGEVSQSAGNIVNHLTAEAEQSELITANNATSSSTPIANTDLEIVKTASVETVGVEDSITYTVVVTNQGPHRASGIRIIDLLPAGLSSQTPGITIGSCVLELNQDEQLQANCSVGSLEAGESVTLTIDVFVSGYFDRIVNTATVEGREYDPRPTNNLSSAVVTQPRVDLGLTGTVSADPAIVGAELVYSLQVTNTGNQPAADATLTATLAPGVTFLSASRPDCSESEGTVVCSNGSINPGQTVNLNLTVRPDAVGTSIPFEAIVSTSSVDIDPSNNQVSFLTAATERSDLSITQSSSVDPIRVDDAIVFTVTVTNSGPTPASSVEITDVFPGSVLNFLGAVPSVCTFSVTDTLVCAVGNLASGANASIDIAFTFVEPTSNPTITNTVTVAASQPDPNGANNTDALVLGVATVDLGVTVTDNPDPVENPDSVTYTITVTNGGPDAAIPAGMALLFDSTAISIDSAVPEQGSCQIFAETVYYVDCDLGSLPSGGSTEISVVVTPLVSFMTLQADASVYSPERDVNFENDTATELTTVGVGPF